MIVRAIEIRDKATFIPALAIYVRDINEAQRYLMLRCGFPVAPHQNSIILMRMNDQRANSDPYGWNDRTHQVAHLRLLEIAASPVGFAVGVRDGMVIDVEHILGETVEPKRSERETNPL